MRAAVCRAFGQPLSIEEVSLAEPGPMQVQVRIAACAICHSDIAYAEGAWGGDLPAVYGHEAAGHVTALGPGATGLALGDRVLVTEALEKMSGKKVRLSEQVDATLLGGLVVRLGDTVHDGSLSNQLARLRERMVHGAPQTH